MKRDEELAAIAAHLAEKGAKKLPTLPDRTKDLTFTGIVNRIVAHALKPHVGKVSAAEHKRNMDKGMISKLDKERGKT